MVLSSFFWGYVFLQLPAAQLGKKFGAKWLLVGCTLTNAGFCISIPLFAEYCGSVGVIIARFFQGLSQGCIPSLLHTLLGYWAPPSERSVIGTVSYSGTNIYFWPLYSLSCYLVNIGISFHQNGINNLHNFPKFFTGAVFGNILALSTTGLISSSWVGWPCAFYLFGALGVKWVLLWTFLGADRPGLHKDISAAERTYIETSLAYQDRRVTVSFFNSYPSRN